MLIIQTVASTRFDHGGTSRSVPALCNALAALQQDVHLVSGRPSDLSIECNIPSKSVKTHWIPESPLTGRWFVGRGFKRALGELLDSAGTSALIQDHGLWLPSNHAVASLASTKNVLRVVTPRGMMSGWAMANGRTKKQLFWRFFQKNDLRTATAFHATSHMEADEIRKLGFEQPIAVVPNGVNFPLEVPSTSQRERRRLLFLSRIHPKKGLINLLRAWHATDSDWELAIAGPDELGHQAALEAEAIRLGVSDSVHFLGAVGDCEKWKIYDTADAFVLPSFSENFGIVVAEPLAAKLPVITTTGTPWSTLEQNNLGWWVEPTVAGLADAIRDVTSLSNQVLERMGHLGSLWVRAEFGWDRIAANLKHFYCWLLCGGERPGFVV